MASVPPIAAGVSLATPAEVKASAPTRPASTNPTRGRKGCLLFKLFSLLERRRADVLPAPTRRDPFFAGDVCQAKTRRSAREAVRFREPPGSASRGRRASRPRRASRSRRRSSSGRGGAGGRWRSLAVAHGAEEVRLRLDRGRARGPSGRFRKAQYAPAASARLINAPPCRIPPAVQSRSSKRAVPAPRQRSRRASPGRGCRRTAWTRGQPRSAQSRGRSRESHPSAICIRLGLIGETRCGYALGMAFLDTAGRRGRALGLIAPGGCAGSGGARRPRCPRSSPFAKRIPMTSRRARSHSCSSSGLRAARRSARDANGREASSTIRITTRCSSPPWTFIAGSIYGAVETPSSASRCSSAPACSAASGASAENVSWSASRLYHLRSCSPRAAAAARDLWW